MELARDEARVLPVLQVWGDLALHEGTRAPLQRAALVGQEGHRLAVRSDIKDVPVTSQPLQRL
jgi:hypothetical protein